MKKKLLTNIMSRLGALGNLKEPESVGALVPLKKQEVVPSRREFLKKAGSAVAQTALPRGVLTTLIEKGLEPVAEEKVPISTLLTRPYFSNSIDFKKAVLEDEMSKTVALDKILDENSKINDIDALSDDEVDKLFEYAFGRPASNYFTSSDVTKENLGIEPTLWGADNQLGDRVYDILRAAELSVEDFVTKRLQGKEIFPSPKKRVERYFTEPEEFTENNLLSSFIDRMNKSRYTDKEIIEFIERSLGKVPNIHPSLWYSERRKTIK